jgi:16S rRNA U516 pseudouridylate synthase RsuA-like enzyme
MARHLGHQVSRLKRIRMANIQLGKLPPGAWRYLTGAETKKLLKGLADLGQRKK